MKKNYRPSFILLIIGMLIGPFGIIMGIFGVGDGAYSGDSNIKAIDSYYLIDYLTICASYNLAIILGLALSGWFLKSGKVKLSKIIHVILIGHLFFIPSFFVSLFLSVIPMEGNIKGFFIFPAFVITAIVCAIGFLIYFTIGLAKLKKENTRVSDKKSLIPYGVSIVVLIFLNLIINNHTTTEVSLISFEHDNFSWGIKQRSKTKAGMVKTSMNDPYIVYIKHKNGNSENSNIKLLKNYHSLYTNLDSVIPVQNKAIWYNKLNPSYTINYNENFEVVDLNKNKSIYRIRKYRPSYTLCLSQSKANLEAMGIIAEDIKQNSTTHNDLTKLIEGFVIEAVAINKDPVAEEIFLKNDGSLIQVSMNGEVGYRDKSSGKEYSLEGLGEIKEGVFYSLSGNFDVEGSPKIPYKPINYNEFKNDQNKSLEFLYTHIDGRKCATDIEFAINNCPDVESVYLLDPDSYNGIPENINKLRKLWYLNARGIDLGKIPESICDLYFLNTINFSDSKSLVFPDQMDNLSKLYFISVVNCNLKEIPKPFYTLKEIRDMNLKGNNISTLPKELAQLHTLTDITIDFNPDLTIASEIISNKRLRLDLVVYSEKDKLKAEKFIEQYAGKNEQLREQIYNAFKIYEAY
ncbi:hypothetical protein LCM02_02505 [Lutimonas saemankumensis]|uniref:hypothetical protein n=1 Tax=Lutimonas saemankumensis TaxID=483016 RepID=UPI001CD1F508|nr:hypothetical protein [Lutimonas saemankumensis]MCA0931306.1 hypothetical protein [Lutimonas saemankumensis]